MIRVVPLDTYDETQLGKFCQILYTAFGVGTQLVTDRAGIVAQETLDAVHFLEHAPFIPAYADDKILFLVSQKLHERKVHKVPLPTHGLAQFGKSRAIVSTFGMKNFEAELTRVGRQAMHQVGHLWELHHCLDPRCAMYPNWTLDYEEGEATFCNFCREKSEDKIRLAKS